MAKRCRELTFSLLLPVYAIVIIVLAAIFAGLLIFSYTVWRKRQRRRAYITSAIDQKDGAVRMDTKHHVRCCPCRCGPLAAMKTKPLCRGMGPETRADRVRVGGSQGTQFHNINPRGPGDPSAPSWAGSETGEAGPEDTVITADPTRWQSGGAAAGPDGRGAGANADIRRGVITGPPR
eukprot:3634341-Rhodomonas_salina.2